MHIIQEIHAKKIMENSGTINMPHFFLFSFFFTITQLDLNITLATMKMFTPFCKRKTENNRNSFPAQNNVHENKPVSKLTLWQCGDKSLQITV